MPHISSFKAQYRQTPARASTPPRPAFEPLSPLLGPTSLSTAPPAGHHTALLNGAATTLPGQRETGTIRAHVPSSSTLLAAPYEPPRRPAALSQPRPPYSMGLPSPIEALADVAMSSQHTSPTHVEPARRAAYSATALSPAAHLQPGSEPASKHAYTRAAEDGLYSYTERPAKRARSEFYGSPPYGQPQSRPATSHIPGWSYNVEHMVDNRTRMYQDSRASAFAPHSGIGANDRLSDAQLLLDFFTVSAHTAQSPPSTAKRPSTSYSAAVEQVAQQPQSIQEPVNPYPAASHTVNYNAQHLQAPPDARPLQEGSFRPSGAAEAAVAGQTRTPPEEIYSAPPHLTTQHATPTEELKPKKHQGWPKGKPRGPRSAASTSKRKKTTPKPKAAALASTSVNVEQFHSPQSLPTDNSLTISSEGATPLPQPRQIAQTSTSQARRHSFSNSITSITGAKSPSAFGRAHSLPIDSHETPQRLIRVIQRPNRKSRDEQPDLICAACKSSDSEVKVGDGEQWIGCDGCKEWYHYACAGFNSEREVREINKFYCEPCRPKFGETTKVRKSVRAHTTVDYAGLNEGVLKMSDDTPEHHYIAAFKNGDIDFTPESFARLPPELITSDFLEKTNGFKEPLLVPGSLNPRPKHATNSDSASQPTQDVDIQQEESSSFFEYDSVFDDGQDKLDMVIPVGLTVRRVAELYGPNEPVPVIDVKAQEGEGKKWTMSKWADYYEQQGEKPVRNVISLEVSRSRLGKLIRRPKAVRDMDLQDAVWRDDDKSAPPPVQFYCLMSVADCFTDFHIDFGGSSVYYHIVKGRKVFFFIPPTKQNLKKYEDWCLSPNQGHDWLGKQVKDCYRVDLYPGDTMLIPSGWIHAVWTPEDSLVIGGNFLTRMHYGMQIKVLEIEKNTKVALQFRYPFFQKIMWLTAIKYLEEDPVPEAVQLLLQSGDQFERSIPVYCEPDRFGHNSHLGARNYNRRYYSKHELEGLTDLLNYIWRTVLISLDKIDVPQKTRSAVNKSIPKGHGDPLVLARQLAMWIAWKRGNETIPSWAFPDASLPEATETGEKKLSAAQVKRLERESLNEALRATAERSSARIRATDHGPEPSPPDGTESEYPSDQVHTSGPLTGFLRPSASNPHITTPKTSQLGPKRVACDACRKRRIRCKHKDELIDTSKPGMHTIDLSGSYGISVKRRLSDHSIADSQSNAGNGPVNGGPIMADVNGDPYALKSGRVKACADCRKSKRRCIHDEYGNVDPIKANEVPIPRGSASKKRRVSDEDPMTMAKRMKYELSYDDEFPNGEIHARQPLSSQFNGNSFLRDLAYSAQQALNQSPDDDFVPLDPALQGFANGTYPSTDLAPSYEQNGDSIMTSIEYQNGSTVPMEGGDYVRQHTEPHGPSVEPLTPRPPSRSDTIHVHTNGLTSKTTSKQDSKRRPSSPISPKDASMTSPTEIKHNSHVTRTNNDDTNKAHGSIEVPPPPATPITSTSRSTRGLHNHKSGNTPSRGGRNLKTPKSTPGGRRRDSRDVIKTEHGAGAGMLGMIDPNLDQASIDLIKQLQQEDLGLRRRSR